MRLSRAHQKVSSVNHEEDGAGTDSCIEALINDTTGINNAALTATGATEIANNATRTITHRPNSAFFNADRYMPLGYTQGVSYLSITLLTSSLSKTIGLSSTVHEKKNNNNIKYFMCLI